MTGELNPNSRRDTFGSKINRAHSPVLAFAMPWLAIMAGSLLPTIALVAGLPYVPPLGYLMLLSWRMIRPGLLPPWAGIPLGIFDDLYNGQPFGFAILFWSLSLVGIEFLEARFPWRSFLHDWLTATVLIGAYLIMGVAFSGAGHVLELVPLILPQFLLSVLLYPFIGRIVSILDRLRLLRIRTID